MPTNASQIELREHERPSRCSVSHHSNRSPRFEKKRSGPPISPEPGHAPRDEAGLVHQIAEDQPVSEGNDESGAEQERPVLKRGQRDGESAASGPSWRRLTTPRTKIDPHCNEDGLDDSSRDEADRQAFVLPLRDRIEDDACSDVREDEEELQDDREVETLSFPSPPMYAAGSSRTDWKRRYAGIDVTNVTMNSTPNIRPCLWSSAIPKLLL